MKLTGHETFESEVDRILAQMRATMLSKRHDYGPGNLSEFGEYGILVRVSDKFHRLKNLIEHDDTPVHEAIDDTWLDMANYGVLALLMRTHGTDGFAALPLGESDHE